MKTFEIRGIKVHVEDEELAKSLEPEPEPEVDEKDAEVLLKELEEWLAAGRSQVLNKARKELRKQFVGAGDATSPYSPVLPIGAGVRSGSVQASSGIVAAPNVPSWLSGVPQAQAAAQQIALGSLIEAIVGQLSPLLEEFAAKLAEWVSTVAEGLFRTISEVAERMAEAQEKLGEKLADVSEKLEAVAEKLPEGAGESPLPEALPEVPPVEEVPPAAEEAAPPAEGVAEEAPPAEVGAGEEVPTPPAAEEEKEAKSVATTPEVTAALFSPQFLAAFARHLSQMTKEIIDTQTRKSQNEPSAVKPQSAFEIADVIASTLRKSQQTKGKVETDLTAPVKTAAAPEGEGANVAEQVKGAAKDEAVRKHLEEAEKVAKEKAGD
jgi:gas vesicle protein